VGFINPVTDEQRRQTAHAMLALRVAPLFALGCVAALGQDLRGSNRIARSLLNSKIGGDAGHASISTGS